MDSDTIAKILAVDIPADKKVEILAILNGRPERSKAAERMARYRAKRHACVTSDVTRDATEVTPPSPPPLSPLHPPHPAPTPASSRTCEAPAKPGKPSSRETDISQANSEPIPIDLMADGFPAAWADWTAHRSELYRREKRKAWTARAARMTLAECARHGPKIAVMAITAAISNGWQGLVWERLQISNTSPNGNHRTTHRPAVTRNVDPLPADRPSLNATAINSPGKAGMDDAWRPSVDADGEICW